MTNQNDSLKDNSSLAISYVKLEGHSEPGYFLDVIIRSENGRSVPVKMMIDTGASISCVPEDLLEVGSVLYGKPVIVRDYEGKKHRRKTYKVDILLMDSQNVWGIKRPFRGVLARKKVQYGLLGMDVLCDYDILLDSGGGLMARTGGGE